MNLNDFVACYFSRTNVDVCYTSRHERQETKRFKAFDYNDLIKSDKINLDIFWLKDDALEKSALRHRKLAEPRWLRRGKSAPH